MALMSYCFRSPVFVLASLQCFFITVYDYEKTVREISVENRDVFIYPFFITTPGKSGANIFALFLPQSSQIPGHPSGVYTFWYGMVWYGRVGFNVPLDTL